MQGSPTQHVANADQSGSRNSQQVISPEAMAIDLVGFQMFPPEEFPTWPTTDPNLDWEISNALGDMLDDGGMKTSFDYL